MNKIVEEIKCFTPSNKVTNKKDSIQDKLNWSYNLGVSPDSKSREIKWNHIVKEAMTKYSDIFKEYLQKNHITEKECLPDRFIEENYLKDNLIRITDTKNNALVVTLEVNIGILRQQITETPGTWKKSSKE